jgi:CheY-like chemotaxis protein
VEVNMASDPIRILIVDDDQDVLIKLEHLLESEGYRTVTAWSGKEALALSETVDFDLLLVDEHVGDVTLSFCGRGCTTGNHTLFVS